MREIGQRRGGNYEARKSKTYPVAIRDLYRAWSDARRRKRWLGESEMTVRKATPEKSMRLIWGDGTHVQVYFWEKDESKSQLQNQHTRLAAHADIERVKRFWSERLAALAGFLA